MKASNPSGENAAVVALLMFKGMLLDVVTVVVVGVEEDDFEDDDEVGEVVVVVVTLAMYTWFGVETVSENTAAPPLCETPITLPVTTPNRVPGAVRDVNALVVVPRLPGLMDRAPYWLPRKARSPAGSNMREFGGAGMGVDEFGTFVVVGTL